VLGLAISRWSGWAFIDGEEITKEGQSGTYVVFKGV